MNVFPATVVIGVSFASVSGAADGCANAGTVASRTIPASFFMGARYTCGARRSLSSRPLTCRMAMRLGAASGGDEESPAAGSPLLALGHEHLLQDAADLRAALLVDVVHDDRDELAHHVARQAELLEAGAEARHPRRVAGRLPEHAGRRRRGRVGRRGLLHELGGLG